ncbi:MAG: hypothetical protein Q9164_001865 [Protoblastenia rupestris]
MFFSQAITTSQLPLGEQGIRARLVTPSYSPTTPNWSPVTHPRSSIAAASVIQSPTLPELPTWASISLSDLPKSIRDKSSILPKYDFRLGPRDPDKNVPTTWLDQDATGTYDPASKRDPWLRPPLSCISRQKRPRPERRYEYLEYRSKRPKTLTWQRGRHEGKRLIVTFTFKTDNGVAILHSYGSKLDYWPGAAFVLANGEPDWESWWNAHEPATDNEGFMLDTYDLRDRSGMGPFDHCTSNHELRLEDVTLGNPAARGCKACFELGHPCPLLEEGTRYPCFICQEDGVECELIMEPQVKGRCTACTKRKVVCSFVQDGSVRGPCNPCIDSSLKCVAGPKSGRTRTGPCLDAGFAADTENDLGRSFVKCFQCRTSRRRGSLQSKRYEVPCNRCRDGDISCTFEPIGRRKPDARSLQRNQPLPPATSDKALAPRVITTDRYAISSTRTITTRLAHPISFNHQPSDDQTLPCHWCDDLVYGLLGLGEVNVEVLDFYDARGYVEVRGGHTAAGYPPSRMCEMCTLERIMVAACRIHELEPIKGMDPETFDFETVADHMGSGMASKAMKDLEEAMDAV